MKIEIETDDNQLVTSLKIDGKQQEKGRTVHMRVDIDDERYPVAGGGFLWPARRLRRVIPQKQD